MEAENFRMNLSRPEGANELFSDVVGMPHVGLGHVEDDLHAGAGHRDAEAGLAICRQRAAPDGPHTVGVKIREVEQQNDPSKYQILFC